jgi:hypothetical protein
VTRHDVALGKIFNWDVIPAQDTYKRFFNKFDQVTVQFHNVIVQTSLFFMERSGIKKREV